MLATQMKLVERLMRALKEHDEATYRHSRRVKSLAHDLALALGLPEVDAAEVALAAGVHDVGKLKVDAMVLQKTFKLHSGDWGSLIAHPVDGAEMLEDIPLLADLAPAVLHHHERWDGRGYPHCLRGEQIPLASRIIAIVDVFDAISSHRPYRTPMTSREALDYVAREAGGAFDPRIVWVFLHNFSERHQTRLAANA